jgi:hypothetical protein
MVLHNHTGKNSHNYQGYSGGILIYKSTITQSTRKPEQSKRTTPPLHAQLRRGQTRAREPEWRAAKR